MTKHDSIPTTSDEAATYEGEEEKGKKSPFVFVQQIPIKSLDNTTTSIYGPPGIGKSTLASQFPGAFFMRTEEGMDWLPHFGLSIIDWDTSDLEQDSEGRISGSFINVCRWLDEEKPTVIPGTDVPFRFLVIDTIDVAFRMCTQAVCDGAGISSPADLEWGKGWKMLSDEWSRVLTRMTKLPYGLIFISHDRTQQIKSRARQIDVITPDMPGSGAKIVLAMMDLILYCYMSELVTTNEEGIAVGEIQEARVIRCHPMNNIIAKDRSGCLPTEIKLSYKELVKYFPDTPPAMPKKAKK